MKLKALIVLFVLVSTGAWPQAARYDSAGPAQSSVSLYGYSLLKAEPLASITVCSYPATGGVASGASGPCTNKAPVCPDSTLVGCTTGAPNNPVSADAQGNFGFWVNPGLFQFTICPQSGVCRGPFNALTAIGVDGSGNPALSVGSLNKTCYADQQSGADAGAKINACVAALPNGGEINATGFGAGVQNYSSQVAWHGKVYRLICDPTTVFTYSGTGAGVLIGESSDYSRVQGCTFDLNNNAGTTYGIDIQGSWYVVLERVHILGAPTAGIRLSNDGVTNRGYYFPTIKDSVIGDTLPGVSAPPLAAKKNAVGVQIESVNSTGVTFPLLVGTWVTYAVGDGVQIKATTGQAIGTTFIGGGSSYNGGNGVYVNGASADFHAVGGSDIEGNTGWGMYCEANVIECDFTGSFSSNTSGDFTTIAQRTEIHTNGVDWVYSGGATPNNPPKEFAKLQSAPLASGVEQWSVPLKLNTSNGEVWLQGFKATTDAPYAGLFSSDHSSGLMFDPALDRLIWRTSGRFGQVWAPDPTCVSCTITFPTATSHLASYDLAQTWSSAVQTFTGKVKFNNTVNHFGFAPAVNLIGDNGCQQFGIDQAATPIDRDFYLSQCNDITGPGSSVFDYIYGNNNSSYQTLASSISAGVTTIPLSGNLTLDGGATAIMLGRVSLGTQEQCTVTAGSGTSSLTVSTCSDSNGNSGTGTLYAHTSGHYVTVLASLMHQPTIALGGDLANPNMRLNVYGDRTNQLTMGGIAVLGGTGTRAAKSGPIQVRAGTGGTTALQVWINENYQTAIQSSASNRTGTDGVTATSTSFTSVTAAFTEDDMGKFVVATGIPNGTYITGIVSGTQVTLNQATTASASGLSWTLYEPFFRVMNNAGFPYFTIHPGAGSGALVALTNTNCFSAGCSGLPGNNLEVKSSGTNNVTFSVTTPSNGGAKLQCQGASAACSFGTTNASTLSWGTNGPTVGVFMDANDVISYAASTAVSSNPTIVPTKNFFHVTGTTTIQTITAPTACTQSSTMCQITIIPDAIFSTNTAGNIALASTSVVNKALIMTYDPATVKWYPSY